MKTQTGMLVIPDDNDKTNIPDDALHAVVCPHCGSNVFDSTDIVSYDNYEDHETYRCWGGFGCITYRWVPHKCMACNTKFLIWKATKSLNASVLGYYAGLIITIITMFVSTIFAICLNKTYWLADIAGLLPLTVFIANIEVETFNTDIGMEEMIEFAHFPNDEKVDRKEIYHE